MACKIHIALTFAIPMGDAASVVVAIANAEVSGLRGTKIRIYLL